jgi:predicted nucleotidyltransferase
MDKDKILYYLQSKQQYFYDNFGIKFIGIFGSSARDEMNSDSDIDILYKIETNKKLSMFKYLKINSLLEELFHKKIDLVRFETLKPTIKKYINKDLIYV